MKKFYIVALTLSAFCVIYAEEGEFQRLELLRDKNQLTLEGFFSYYAQNVSDFDLYAFRPQFAVEYTLKNHGFRADLPYALAAYNNQEARRQLYYGFEDLALSYEYLKQINHLNLFFGGFWNIPLSENNEYISREGILPTGSGRHNLGLTFSVTGIKDPVVWSASFRYGVGLPKEERHYWTWEPGNMQANVGMTAMFNETFGFSLNLIQSVSLPPLKDGRAEREELRTSTVFRPAFMILSEDWYVRINLDIPAYPIPSPFVLTVLYGYSFEFPKNRSNN